MDRADRIAKALERVAAGELSTRQAAAEAGVGKSTLQRHVQGISQGTRPGSKPLLTQAQEQE